MVDKQTSRNVNAREALECIRGQMSNADVMEKFKISPQGYADLLRQLFMRKLITEEDMIRRGIRFKIIRAEPEPGAAEGEPSEEPAATTEVTYVPPAPLLAPAVSAEDEEFLDTVTLTELLTFKTPAPPAPPETRKPEAKQPPALEEIKEENGSSDKKGRFSISGFFKKARRG